MRVFFSGFMNIFSSVAIVFVNKYIFTHYQIHTVTLTMIHMLFTSFGLFICSKFKTFVPKVANLIDVLPLAAAFSVFIVFTNLSLEYNNIGTSQLFKVLTTPVVAFITWHFYKTKYSYKILSVLLLVIGGVTTYSVNDIKLTWVGTIIALIGILSGSFYQIWISERIKDLEMNSQQLLYHQAPLSGLLLIPFTFIFESLPDYEILENQRNPWLILILSGFIAFLVNLSIYWFIEDT